MEMSEEKHVINIKYQNANIKNKEQNLKMKEQNIKLVLVDKEEREKAEQEIWRKINKPETELCYILEKGKGEFFVN